MGMNWLRAGTQGTSRMQWLIDGPLKKSITNLTGKTSGLRMVGDRPALRLAA